ncbi:RING-H2 finger protein ATL45 [Acorus calamus]|uniref:RING-H2 finger protein ATL45 n=1 Tax=Acorus calamus TaxID=4465 RepID=A0AAV9F628_ACOCL|nr:RING-H2 finger protein ATL45 [Acorus calamus]
MALPPETGEDDWRVDLILYSVIFGVDLLILRLPRLTMHPQPANERDPDIPCRGTRSLSGRAPKEDGEGLERAQSEFEVGEEVQVLEMCVHAFHVYCVDRWLQ